MDQTLLRFGDHEIDLAGRELRRGRKRVVIESRPLDLLIYLLRHRHRVVSKSELLEQLWTGERATPGALWQAVSKLRRALAADGRTVAIRTVNRVGFRFVAQVDGAATPPRPLTLAILPFEDVSEDKSEAYIELGLMSMVASMLGSEPRLSLIERQSVLAAVGGDSELGAAERAAGVQRQTGASVALHARVQQRGGQCRIAYRLFGCDTGLVTGAVAATSPTAAAENLALEVSGTLLGDAQAARTAVISDSVAAEAFARGMQCASEQRWAQAANLFRLALEYDPENTAIGLELLRALSPIATDDHEVGPLAAKLLAEADDDAMLAASVHQSLGRFHLSHKSFEDARRHLQCALDQAPVGRDSDWSAQTLLLQGTVAFQSGDYRSAGVIARQLHAQCAFTGNRVLDLGVRSLEACVSSAVGDYEHMVECSQEQADLARSLRIHRRLGEACGNAAQGLLALGRLAEAAAYAEEGFGAALTLGDRKMIDTHAECTSEIYCLAGNAAGTGRVMALLDAVSSPQHQADAVLCARAHHAACSRDPAGAVLLFGAALQRERESGFLHAEEHTLPYYIEALVLCDRLDEAETELQRGVQWQADLSRDLADRLLLCSAMLAHRRGRASEALDLLEKVRQTSSAPLWHLYACVDAAWLQAEAGHPVVAGASLDQIAPPLRDLATVRLARARVLFSGGDVQEARATYLRCMSAPSEFATDPYLAGLGPLFAAAHPDRAAIPVAPFLLSRLPRSRAA